MRVFDFTHAIVREPGRSVVKGLSSGGTAPTYEGVLIEHRAYVAALRDAGLNVDVLPPLETFPDSVFVEDPALVFPEGAILLRPGARSRLGECEPMRGALESRFARVLELGDGEFADGGDVLVTQGEVIIGLSARTSRAGAQALCARLGELGRRGRIAETPRGVLHFKTAVSLLDESTVLATRPMAAMFADLDVIIVPDGEEAAANAVRVNDRLLLGDGFPRTIDLLSKTYKVVPLRVSEVGKLDAGLSCMSLRWRKA